MLILSCLHRHVTHSLIVCRFPSQFLWSNLLQIHWRGGLLLCVSARFLLITIAPYWLFDMSVNSIHAGDAILKVLSNTPDIRNWNQHTAVSSVHYVLHSLCQCCVDILYTECHRRKGPNFGRVFLMLNHTDITQNTYIQSWTVTEIMAREVWNFDSCYTLTDCQIHIETGRNMWFL